MTPELRAAFDRLENYAEADPRLNDYRVSGQPGLLDRVADDWFLSQDMEHLITEGGWWPGRFCEHFAKDDIVSGIVAPFGIGDQAEPEVGWFAFGTVWDRDQCYTPALTEQTSSAPIVMCSSQGLWLSVVFPTEAAMLEAFLITYETMGFDEDPPRVNPFFVERITSPPTWPNPTDEQRQLHARLAARSKQWRTDHRCWLPNRMPLLESSIDFLDVEIAAALLGLPQDQVRVEHPPSHRDTRYRGRNLQKLGRPQP